MTEVLDRVVAVFRRHLSDDIGPDDNFFDMGGDSLLAEGVMIELAALLGRQELPLVLLLDYPTANELAEALADPQNAAI